MAYKQARFTLLTKIAIAFFATQTLGIAEAQTAPSPCKIMYFGNLKLSCLIPGSGGVTTGLQGTDPSSIPAATQWCQSVTPGTVTSTMVPAPGSMACYQFTVQNMGPINVEASLPAGIVGSAELYNINSNTSGFKLSESYYPNSPLSTNYTTQFMRVVLVVKASNGIGDAPMNIGVNTAGSTPTPSNGSMSTAVGMSINDTAYGNIASPLGSAYYFYPLKAGQTKATIRATFTANQQAGYRFVQKTGTGTYNTQPEIVLTPSQSNANITVTSPYPANTTTTTAPAGVLVRVTGISATAPVNEPFTARVGISDVTISTYDIANTETISRWYPVTPAQLEVANYVTSTALVTDVAGNPVKGQDVQLTVNRNTKTTTAIQTSTYRTDDTGRINVTTQLPPCSGTVDAKYNYGPPGTPTDHWDGTAQPGQVIFDVLSGISGSRRTVPFERICKETYKGYY